jgi:hypothetical protein
MTGHLAMFQIVRTVSFRPSPRPMASTIGPLRTTIATMTAAKRTPIRVTSSWSGLSFQILRPSGVS